MVRKMAKIGRNDICPCGSGRKYKKCCGAVTLTGRASEVANEPPSTAPALSAGFAYWGLPGFQQDLIFYPVFEDPNDPRGIGGPGGLPGKYKVVFTLSRPGFSLLPEHQYSVAEQLKGDSHLAIAEPKHAGVDRVRIDAKGGGHELAFIGYPNEQGFLGKIELESIDGEHFRDAALKAYRLLAPALSTFSLYSDIPMHVFQIDLVELRTGCTKMSMLAPFRETALFRLPVDEVSEELRIYASLYREGMNNNSPNYQFLCYYKIIEGIRKRQQLLVASAIERGETIPSRTRHRIPTGRDAQIKWLNSLFPVSHSWDEMALASTFPKSAEGRKVNDVIDSELDGIRNKIAHAVLRSGEATVSIDEGLDLEPIEAWLPLAKCIARLLMKDEFPEFFTR